MMEIFLKLMLSFSLILLLMFIFFYALRKLYGTSPDLSMQMNMRVCGQINLQPKKSIYLVKVLNRLIIVGTSDNSITLLSEINDPEIIRAIDEIFVSGKNSNKSGNVFKLN